MGEKSVRIRLKFRESGILTKQQVDQGLQQCWHLVSLEDLPSVADVASDICDSFNIQESCPDGIVLEVDGFILPASQPSQLLKECDLVRISRRKNTLITSVADITREVTKDHLGVINGYRFAPYGGLELRALDEFEKETGGYQSEQEEGEMETDTSLDGVPKNLEKPRSTLSCFVEKERIGKKRKRRIAGVELGKRRRDVVPLGITSSAIQQQKLKPSKPSQRVGVEFGTADKFQRQKSDEDEHEDDNDEKNEEDDDRGDGDDDDDEDRIGRTNIPLRETKGKVHDQAKSFSNEKEKDGSGKKRKKSKKGNCEVQSELLVEIKAKQSTSTEGGLCVGEDASEDWHRNKHKKGLMVTHELSKARYPLSNDVVPLKSTLDGNQVENESEESPKKKSRRKKKRSEFEINHRIESKDDAAKEKKAKKAKSAKKGSETKTEDAEIGPPARLSRTSCSKDPDKGCKVTLTQNIRGDSWMDEEDTLMDSDQLVNKQRSPGMAVNSEGTPEKLSSGIGEMPTNMPQRPSRSARRKKAKRQWLREQAKMAELPHVEAHLPGMKAEKVILRQDSYESPAHSEKNVEVEAEEEVLPIVVRAGHIRFEPFDEDGTHYKSQPSLPILRLGEQLKSKRQGQNWGQEKSAEKKQKGKRGMTEITDFESFQLGDNGGNIQAEDQADPVDLEKLPLLQGVPQEGDVLAYRLVELTQTWTPELSSYRVGIAAHVDHGTQVIKLDPHPDFPIYQNNDDMYDEDSEGAQPFTPPYDESGSLEIDLSALVELRLLLRKISEKQTEVAGENVEVGEDAARCNIERSASLKPCSHVNTNVANTCMGNPGDAVKTLPISLGVMAGAPAAETEDTHATREPSPRWQALLSEELERKKSELRLKKVDNVGDNLKSPTDVKESGTTSKVNGPEEEPASTTNEGCHPSSGEPNKAPAKGRKFKYLRSAGVGSIVALLRAQQVL